MLLIYMYVVRQDSVLFVFEIGLHFDLQLLHSNSVNPNIYVCIYYTCNIMMIQTAATG